MRLIDVLRHVKKPVSHLIEHVLLVDVDACLKERVKYLQDLILSAHYYLIVFLEIAW